MEISEIVEKIIGELEAGSKSKVRALLVELHPADIAAVMTALPTEQMVDVFHLLPVATAGDVIVELADEPLESILTQISPQEISGLAKRMDSDEVADIIADLPAERRAIILSSLPLEDSTEVKELLKFPESSAGGIMDTNFTSVNQGMKVGSAIGLLRETAPEPDQLYYVYVVDDDSKPTGYVTLADLLLASEDGSIESIAKQFPDVIHLDDDQEKVASVINKYDLLGVPVVDDLGVMKGVVRIDDAIDVLEEEATEDILRMGGADVTESVFTPTRRSVGKRLPWLYINLVTAMLAAGIVGLFTRTLSAVITIAVFMPVVANMGGNAGTQTLAVTVRGLAVGELTYHNTWSFVLKEAVVGLLKGLAVGLVTAVVAFLWDGSAILGLVIGLSLVINLLIGSLMGVMIPVTLRRMKLDPALASGVFLTTITDAVGFFSLLGLATLFLKYLK
jgi:magnesium transporter